MRDEDLRNVDGCHNGSTLSQQPCVMAFSAADIQPRQPFNLRQHCEEGGGVEVVAVDVVSGSRQFRPGVSVGVPKPSYFFVIHLISPPSFMMLSSTGDCQLMADPWLKI